MPTLLDCIVILRGSFDVFIVNDTFIEEDMFMYYWCVCVYRLRLVPLPRLPAPVYREILTAYFKYYIPLLRVQIRKIVFHFTLPIITHRHVLFVGSKKYVYESHHIPITYLPTRMNGAKCDMSCHWCKIYNNYSSPRIGTERRTFLLL